MNDGDGEEHHTEEGTLSDLYDILVDLFATLWALIKRFSEAITIGIALVIFVIQTFFEETVKQVVPSASGSFVDVLTSNTGIAILALIIISLEAWSLKRIFAVGAEVTRMRGTDGQDKMTDGGSSNLPPRDNQGRFTSSDSGPSIILVLSILALGYLVGSQFGETEALVGAIVALLFLAFTDNL